MYNTIGDDIMEILSVDIRFYVYDGFCVGSVSGEPQVKALPYLSIVQSKVGSYSIKLDDGKTYYTGEGGFFVAPSMCKQTIGHYLNMEKNLFKARYVFLDVIINNKYSFDDVFDIPTVLNGKTAELFDEDFDDYERSENICDKMRSLYNMIKHLLEVSKPKNIFRNDNVYPLIEYIRANYKNNITVSEMAELLKMSESNLYSVFKKSTGMSPLKYLNEYRLSMAAGLLQQTQLSIKEIAHETGFDDQFYFSKMFKAKYSLSPAKYRQEMC